MENYKKFPLLLTFATLAVTPLLAQESSEESVKRVQEQFVTNKFKDNWYIGINAGANLYMGEGDAQTSASDRFTPTYNIELGKWFIPYFGARAVYSGFHLKSTELYDHTEFKSWDYYQLRMDVMLNMLNIFSYSPNRIYEPILYAGFGFSNGKDVKLVPTEQIGLINNFRLSRYIDFNLEAGLAILPEDWDGKVGNRTLDGLFTMSAGLSVKFPKRDFAKYNPQYPGELQRLNERVNQLFTSLEQCGIENQQLHAELVEERSKAPMIIEVFRELPLAVVESNVEESTEDITPQEPETTLAEVETTESDVTLETETAVATLQETKAEPMIEFGVLFDNNSSIVVTEQYQVIATMAKKIRSNPNRKYLISGYADIDTGSPDYNLWLSNRRANNVAKVLVEQYGINPSCIITEAKGSSEQPCNQRSCNRVAILKEI
ncbi:MAG: OmpA family protein [Phocaeicola sp.]